MFRGGARRALVVMTLNGIPAASRVSGSTKRSGRGCGSHCRHRHSEVAVSYRQEIPARFVRGGPGGIELESLVSDTGGPAPHREWRIARGLFEACRALKLGHTKGGPRHLYISRYDPKELEDLGLILAQRGERADVVLRIPRFPESLFRAAPAIKGGLVTDVIQCWLDVSHHPARGEEQADFLWRRAIAPSLGSNE